MTGKPIKRSRLSWKLALIYAAIFSLIMFLLNAAVLYGVRLFLVSEASAEVNEISSTVSGDIVGSQSERTSLTDPELVDEVGVNPAVSVRIATPEGIEVNRSSNFRDNGPGMTDRLDGIRQIKIGAKDYMVKNSKVADNGVTIAYVQVLISMEREHGFSDVLLILMISANVAGIGLSLLAGFLTSRRMLSPIDKLTKTVQEIDIRDLDRHVEEGRADDELSRLAKTFNGMLDRLRQSFEKQNRFVSDASHELRTPIAVIRGYTGLLGKWGGENKAIFDESVQAITSETLEMAELIDKLLLLAKSDSKLLDIKKTTFRLSDLLEEVAGEGRMVSPGHIISCDCGEPVEIHADRLMIKQAVRALMENSVKFTPPHGSIGLECSANGGNAVITVKDTGIGVPAEEIGNIFERFYRVDQSRSKETGGSGLGLSIVQLIVKAHNGTVAADSKPGEGLTVRITLPTR